MLTSQKVIDAINEQIGYEFSASLQYYAIAAHFAAATTNNAGYAAQILADNPVGYWGFNEAAATPPSPASLPSAANTIRKHAGAHE